MSTEKDKLGPQPSKSNHLLKDGAGDTGGDGAGTSPRTPPPSHTSRVSFSSRISFSSDLPVQQPQSPAPPGRGDKPPRHSRHQQSSKSAGKRSSSARLVRGQGQRSGAPSPVLPAPPANTAARQCRRLRTCVACSGKTTPESLRAVPSTPSTPASIEPEPLLVHQLTQTEPPEHAPAAAAERVDQDMQTESPGRLRQNSRVRLFRDRETQTKTRALPPGTASAPGGSEPHQQRPSLFRRLLRACRCTRAQPEPLGASPGPKGTQQPQGVTQGHTSSIGVLMVLQEPTKGPEWLPSSWPWLVETSL